MRWSFASLLLLAALPTACGKSERTKDVASPTVTSTPAAGGTHDFVFSSAVRQKPSVNVGELMEVSVTVTNGGADAAPGTSVDAYWAATTLPDGTHVDATLSTSTSPAGQLQVWGTRIDSKAVGPLRRGESAVVRLSLPADVAQSTREYAIFVNANGSPEADTRNNDGLVSVVTN